jgi:hypothetical protein
MILQQVLRLNENKNFSYEEAHRDFGFSPLALEEGIKLESKSIQAQSVALREASPRDKGQDVT